MVTVRLTSELSSEEADRAAAAEAGALTGDIGAGIIIPTANSADVEPLPTFKCPAEVSVFDSRHYCRSARRVEWYQRLLAPGSPRSPRHRRSGVGRSDCTHFRRWYSVHHC